ncbi:rhodanese-like domain-containing protein [Desulfobaculum bizertense]|uniref:Rhodanese-related sulfurtransferase n=1 Tax=Desulfobaculum bizertense DSM 18034 TaxID=1121442 RepID=A0A1T4WCH4_9BACT|nr:rhodanese-like domain-containing protein [Desulfobaculum bizertense]UIJ37462.1 rhodanese-like domain-containing protein [Desulfobaculum bizertense]SKA74738.1 Rhodanese-related sulfurtransferase [Desulfobaculum bizertense DSM 18034]
MDTFASELEKMDFEFFATGQYSFHVDEAVNLITNPHFLFLDVRAPEEVKYVEFPFAKHIPLDELPKRLDELPRDKFIVPFCASSFRAALAFGYLLSQGYDEVKALAEGSDALAGVLKPGPLYSLEG